MNELHYKVMDWTKEEGYNPAYGTRLLCTIADKATKLEKDRCLGIVQYYLEANKEGDNTVALLQHLYETIEGTRS